MKHFYYCVDGDQIGRALEVCIFLGNPESVIEFSKRFESEKSKIIDFLLKNDAQIILSSGDGVIAESDIFLNIEDLLLALDFSFSAGVGCDMVSAALAMRAAKARGGRRVVVIEEIQWKKQG